MLECFQVIIQINIALVLIFYKLTTDMNDIKSKQSLLYYCTFFDTDIYIIGLARCIEFGPLNLNVYYGKKINIFYELRLNIYKYKIIGNSNCTVTKGISKMYVSDPKIWKRSKLASPFINNRSAKMQAQKGLLDYSHEILLCLLYALFIIRLGSLVQFVRFLFTNWILQLAR